MKNPHVIWAAVAIMFMLVTGSVLLSALGRDTTTVTNLAVLVGLPVLAAMGVGAYQQMSASLDQVKDVSNGRTTELLNLVKDLQNQLTNMALQVPNTPPSMVDTKQPAEIVKVESDHTS